MERGPSLAGPVFVVARSGRGSHRRAATSAEQSSSTEVGAWSRPADHRRWSRPRHSLSRVPFNHSGAPPRVAVVGGARLTLLTPSAATTLYLLGAPLRHPPQASERRRPGGLYLDCNRSWSSRFSVPRPHTIAPPLRIPLNEEGYKSGKNAGRWASKREDTGGEARGGGGNLTIASPVSLPSKSGDEDRRLRPRPTTVPVSPAISPSSLRLSILEF
ncbi:hypothetical protein VPH35_077929 [Triticum aestivum]|uniref:Uncharacterized protein n=1 Tax=Aegilops tauschii subsp. strangulata TaxID=200361 RepID=A0A453HZA4_AEGTS